MTTKESDCKILSKNNFIEYWDARYIKNEAKKYCGLELNKYNTTMLQEKLESDFKLIEVLNHTFVNQYGGKRPYIYTLFQRKSK